LNRSSLIRADFFDANLVDAKLTYADLRGANV
jgi:uncharacterized protein YjbI with pentapeptide repeats